MKQLSIEEKAKAYDEALERAKKEFKTCGSMDCDAAKQIFRFSPELKESEDERIKKWLIEKVRGGNYPWPNWEDKVIAWLEEQGEPAKLNEEEQNRFAKGVLTSCALSFMTYLDTHRYEGKMCLSNKECEDIENAFYNSMWDKLHRYYCKYIENQDEQFKESVNKTMKYLETNLQLTEAESTHIRNIFQNNI